MPSDRESLLEMLQLIEATQTTFELPGPTIVHCGAGIGRTGTVITLQLLLQLYKTKGHLDERDVPRTIQKVRSQRSGMVQTEVQYNFIYEALMTFVEANEQRAKTKTNEKYGNLGDLSNQLANLN